MGGVQTPYVQPYIQKAVDKYGWTIVIFEQERIGNTLNMNEKRQLLLVRVLI